LLERDLIHGYTQAQVVIDSVEWCRDRMSNDDLAFLASFERTARLTLDGSTTLFLFHGSPRSHMEDILAETPAELLDQMLVGHHATLMAGGHTHVQMLRQHHGVLLVNPGSVGMPFREHVDGRAPTVLPHAEYAVVDAVAGDVSVTLRRVALARSALRGALSGSSLPLAEALREQYV
jgi:hypothetical protein